MHKFMGLCLLQVAPVHTNDAPPPQASTPTLLRGSTIKAPPPLASTIMATNLGLTEQKVLSQVIWEMRMSS